MIHSTFEISVNGQTAPLYTYLLDTTPELNGGKNRPVLIICPGGGYTFTSDREAEPIAMQMNAAGFHAVILRYSVKPAVFPTALVQLAKAVELVRAHSDEWCLDPEKVFVMGFSAGGHLAASLGVFWNKEILTRELLPAPGLTADAIRSNTFRPNGLLLAYPVISSGEFAHQGSINTVLDGKEELRETISLENQVDKDTPPAFLWHTFEDQSVPVENSLLFAAALRRSGVPFELHVYPKGAHGLSLANEETAWTDRPLSPPGVDTWIKLAINWIRNFR
ncbi:acetylesterase [Spirochaetia bacterium]|nr:acetylesterase [Spirochaetia bacterium]